MTDDPVTAAAVRSAERRAALTTTTTLLRRRFDPRLIAADFAALALTRSIARVAAVTATPTQRRRALVAAGVAAITAVSLRLLYRVTHENPSPEPEVDVKTLG